VKDLFYKPLKINEKEEDVLVWGCIHYGHDPRWDTPLWKMRGYSSSLAHDQGIKAGWRKKATSRTIGFLLGDTIFGQNAEARLLNLFQELEFKTLYIMPGNHQAGWKQLFEQAEGGVLQINSEKTVIFTPNYLEAFIGGQSVVMSHYPILSWNGQGKQSFMLYSHVHSSLNKSELGRMYLAKGKNLEVSVENCPAPLNFREIKEIMRKKEAFSPDHHDNTTQNPF
jgi:calcineurin-like phosphoesterase family protein